MTLRRVWFGDHRSGWSGILLELHFFSYGWGWCIIRWQNPPREQVQFITLRQQIERDHHAYDRMVAAEEAAELEEQERLDLANKIVNEALRRRKAAEADEADNDPL